ncbi:MAG: NDP-sugar synthase [Candidatus Thermoplasmatota archaeon]|nr:NDP-sugar synthase [Candidatus Thermoplasmatota archaeon]
MEAVILSGGFGTRLRPLTYTRPKPLLPIANKPMVQHILDRLPDEVDRAVLASGYKVEEIRAWAETLDHRVELVVIDEEEPLGTGGAIKNVEDEITGEFLCFNGDVLSSLDLDRLVATRREHDAMGALALWEVDEPEHFGVVAMDGPKITDFVEKPDPGQAPTNLINAGTYCFSQDILDHIPAGRKVSIEREIYPKLIEEGYDLIGLPFQGWWVDCGRPEVYLQAHEILLDGTLEAGPGATMDGAWEGWACLGANAKVASGATLTRSILLDGAKVEAGATLVDTIVGEGATVGKDARLTGCVVGDGEHVPAGRELNQERIGGE